MCRWDCREKKQDGGLVNGENDGDGSGLAMDLLNGLNREWALAIPWGLAERFVHLQSKNIPCCWDKNIVARSSFPSLPLASCQLRERVSAWKASALPAS